MAAGTGFGKTILIGDQFVLRGVPAIVSALPFVTEAAVEVTEGEGWTLEDNRREVPGYKEKKKEQQAESINHILEVMKIDVRKTPIKITYGGSLLAGSGVGASAASCVSLARALNATFELGLTVEEINHVGWEGEFAYHGIPSGIDNTASTYGGLLVYRVDNDEKSFEQIETERSFRIVLANSGVTADTSTLNDYVLSLKAEDPDLFDERCRLITEQSLAMRAALERSDLETVGSLLTANHGILIDMGLSHEKLVELCDRALVMGALGAKLTGGGRGGYMLALTPEEGVQELVASTFENDGYAVIRALIGEASTEI
ncbi:MAG: mevalonate kinase [Acidobacteriota bacterium]|nr:mevalonate kinase [Acidobacteriota bacterium]